MSTSPPNRPRSPRIVFGERLQLHRKRMGMTQGELGDLVGCAQSTISDWELGKGDPNVDQLHAIARELRISGNYLLALCDAEVGLEPDQYLVDDRAIERLRKEPDADDVRWAFKVPRNARIVEHEEFERLRRELGR